MKPTRLAAALVLLITVVVAAWAGSSGSIALDHENGATGELAARDVATPTPETVLNLEPTFAPTQPPTPEPTLAPSPEPTVAPTPEPTAEPSPVATERPAPPPTGLDDRALVVERGTSGRREVALTFDAGEGAGYTEQILDLLDKRGIKASFGVTGQWAEQNPELLRRIVADGHMIINHTYDHRSWTGRSPGTEPLTDAERREELRKNEQIIRDIAGYEVKPYFRFTYGDYDPSDLTLLKEEGYDYSLWWTCDTMAWMSSTPQEIVDRCNPNDPTTGGPGAIILMHVAQEGDWEALPAIIDAYEAAGYDFVTMEQMVQP